MPLRFHLLPWDRPLLTRAVAWLTDGWRGDAVLDLSELLVVVPTRQSGRRLREALAAFAAEHGQAVFPPQVVLPEGIIARATADAGVASRIDSMLAWIDVFRSIDLDAFRDVFPVDPPSRSFAWALRLAGEFSRLKTTLGEAGMHLADVTQRAGADFEEAARWRQIAELERRYLECLNALGLRDVYDVRLNAAAAPSPPAGVRRIVLLATPDPLPLALAVLAVHARTLPVDVVVFGPAGGEALFDGWGCPRPDPWTSREFELTDFEQHVHLCADPLAQTAHVVACAQRYRDPDGSLAIGVGDRDVLPFLDNGLARAGFATFDPEGSLFRREAFFTLVEALARLAGESSFEAATAVARCPAVLMFFSTQGGTAGQHFSPARLLRGLDELRCRHLPPTLDAARTYMGELQDEFPELPSALARLADLHATLASGSFPENAVQALNMVFGDRRLDLARESDARLAEAADAWREVLRQVAGAAPQFRGLTASDWWELVLRLLGEGRRFDDKPAGAIELPGWLELLWEDAPHLLAVGLNDGRVPEAVVGDPFLPESLREKLGLKTNAARFARDAYLLQALAVWRKDGGRLDLLLGKTSSVGDPLRPSRLLLRCADTALPSRIEFLFRPAEMARARRPWRRAWQLRPRDVAVPRKISVTAFRNYLRCPFRFYLSHVLGMEAVDATKTELDAMDFGNVCHGALEAMGRETALRDCTDAKVLREFLLATLDRIVRARYGSELALPVIVQVESARQRLAKAAEVQARERAAGWLIEQVEWRFPESSRFVLGGLIVHGKIDRIDRHEGTGMRRVLDYKTSDRLVAPRAAHCRRRGRAESTSSASEIARFTVDGGEYLWTDLQLPLYLWALEREPTDKPLPAGVACGYFHLPKAIGETGVTTWMDYTEEWHAAAVRCATKVAAAIEARRFWPPTESVDYDEFAALFHHGVAASVAWAGSAGDSLSNGDGRPAAHAPGRAQG